MRFCTTFTHGEVPAYNIAEVPWSKAQCPTGGSGHKALQNGHAGATTSDAGIWVEGGTPPATAMRLLVGVCLAQFSSKRWQFVCFTHLSPSEAFDNLD